MGVKLSIQKDETCVHPSQMSDGSIGVVVAHNSSPESYVGRVVQRVGGDLVSLGHQRCEAWVNGCSTDIISNSFRVRILQPGETLEIT